MIKKVEISNVNTANLPVLSNKEKEELLKKVKDGDLGAREKFINGNLRLVLSVIQRFQNRGENADDLFQIGRHAGKATAVAGNDDKNQGLEHEATLHTCQKVEGYNFNRKKGNVSIATTNIVGNSGPHNAPAAI